MSASLRLKVFLLKVINQIGLRRFLVTHQQKTVPPMYKLQDYNEQLIEGSFYKPELQKIAQESQQCYHVKHIIKMHNVKNKKWYFVKWLGYPESSNSWVDNIEIW